MRPGTIVTDINRDDLTPEKTACFNKRIPPGRLGPPDHIAGSVVFLASDLARYVTGAEVLVGGGMSVNLRSRGAMLRDLDPHIHPWNREQLRYPWMDQAGGNFMGPCEPILKTCEPPGFLADAQGVEVLAAVHIDAAHDPAAPRLETPWLRSLAEAPPSRGLPQAIVACADLSRPDVEALLAAHRAQRSVRGIRQTLNVHADPFYDDVGRHVMREPQWRRGFALLHRHELSFDLQIYAGQMPDAAELARAHPQTTIVLNHTGRFVDRDVLFRANAVRVYRI